MDTRVATSTHRDDRPGEAAGAGAAIVASLVDKAGADTPARQAFRRLVLFFPGHDPTDMDYHHGRFANQAERFGKLWSVEVSVTPRLDDGAQPYARWEATARGPNWSTRTEYRILRWEDIIGALDARPDPVRLWRGFGGLWDFLRGGAARGYFRASPRYGLFFFFPYLICALFVAGGFLAGALVLWGLGSVLPAPFAWLAALATGTAIFFALFHRPGRDWRLHQALDDWDLARDYLHDSTPTLDARLDRFAEVLVEAVRAGAHDEIILVGHSLGATLMLGVIDRALDRDPGLADGPTRVNLLTCGATIPKLALHAKGGKVRRQATRIAQTPGLTWVEYQARHDAINFYKFHPVTLRRAGFEHAEPSPPLLRNANIKEMLTHAKLKRLRWHAMRLHYQFLLANEQKAPYDYFMFALGPLSFPDLSARAEGPVGRFAADGSLIA
ncbi:hypothetical protein [Ancylobacter vacuolatus]|uniref:Alpha/beta hydrolase family protein n=1 Tax=Ancylobacter vacuolatus TaxID=223389 RepID=A0ABU0DM89_9HYPH|nr:hypothetical protein [Ancylobacter vacuolatus]MDQ0349551.1 hypothetical protein [Ancylobacter vacuolatus]